MIKIVQGVYGHLVNGIVYPKDSRSVPFELTPEQEERLVKKGVAVYVDAGRTALPDDVEAIPEYSVEMKANELRAIAEKMGLKFKPGTSKAEMVKMMDAEIDAHSVEIDEDEAEDVDDVPAFDASEAIE